MHTFFHGWRRKTGVVTLLMALVFMGCWIRSFYVEDWMFLKAGDGFFFLRSDRGGFSCNICDGSPPKGVPWCGSQPVMHIAVLATGPVPPDDFFVYYSGLTISLALLSAYLLLRKQRKRA